MSRELNLETQKSLSNEIKLVQGRCVEAIQMIENAPPEQEITPENVSKKSLSYIEGLRTEIQNPNIPIHCTDENLLTAQFLNDIKEKTSQMKELEAFMKGSISDVNAEIDRLKEQIRISQEARTRPHVPIEQVKPEHLRKAKEAFTQMKTDLQGLILALYQDKAASLNELLGYLMSESLKEDGGGYVPISSENYCLVELLKERGIISINPYNNMEIKLSV